MQMLKRVSHLLTKRYHNPTSRLLIQLTKYNPATRIISYQTKWSSMSHLIHRYYHEELYGSDGDFEYKSIYRDEPVPVKYMLTDCLNDPLVNQLNSAASLQEVFNIIEKYEKIFEPKHLAQIILVLWDVQKMFCHVNVISNVSRLDTLMNDYIGQLIGRPEFELLLKLIGEKVDDFDLESLSCTLMYLNKIGLSTKHPCLQEVISRLETKLNHEEGEISLKVVSRFLVTIFNNSSSTVFASCNHIIPKVYDYVDKCETAEDIKLVTVCLTSFNKIVIKDKLDNYKNKVKEMIQSGVINKDELSTVLRIILFLNYPHWRNENVDLITQCMSLIKSNIHVLNVHEIIILYEIFYKNHEPADILNEMQRAACKFLHQLEEESSCLLYTRLKLLTCIVFFSSPSQRPYFENMLRKYLDYSLNGENLLELYKSFLFLKNTDRTICNAFWDKLLNVIEHDENFKKYNLLKICSCYINFVKSNSFRSHKFEKRINQWLEGEIEQGILTFVPTRFAAIGGFIIAFGKDVSLINYVANKLNDEWMQYNHIDCLNLSKSLEVGIKNKNPALKDRYIQRINQFMHKCMQKELNGKLDSEKVNILIKNCLHRQHYDVRFNKMMETYNSATHMSSHLMKNISFCLISLNALLPSAIDKMVDYICNYKENILAFNAEDVANLCYYLGYLPERHKEFFEVFKNLLLRDQEKISGLSYLQSCISLCYFNAMSDTLIKQIFNTTFMEKLDLELINCYAKDIYPVRVKRRLMELNRTVCIDYPECNVPWFHKNYVEDTTKKVMLEMPKEPINTNILEYLLKIFKPQNIVPNVITPYGYHVDFVIDQDEKPQSAKLALLVLKTNAFTKINVRLKGYYQMKVRHLEMFGYKVLLLNASNWSKLIYGEDKVNFVNDLILSKVLNVCEINR